MQPYRKSFDSQKTFPFLIVYKDRKKPQRELPNHLHDWVELVYVYEGKGIFFIDNTFHDMEEGDLFTIPGNTIHQAFPDKDNPVRSTAIFFSPSLVQSTVIWEPFSFMQLFDRSQKRRYYKFPLMPDQREVCASYINRIYQEDQERQTGFHYGIITQLQLMLLHITRNCLQDTQESFAKPKSGLSWIHNTFNLIEQHLVKGISLTELAKSASVTPAHLSRVFKKLTGMNLIHYMTKKRMIKAKELLKDTNEKINMVAVQCGFESLPHFHRTFKKHVDLTPAEFRKKAMKPHENQKRV